jgi:hypothetical protein
MTWWSCFVRSGFSATFPAKANVAAVDDPQRHLAERLHCNAARTARLAIFIPAAPASRQAKILSQRDVVALLAYHEAIALPQE